MQLTPTTTSPATAIAPGTVLGTGTIRLHTIGGGEQPASVNVTAGDTIMRGIRDVQAAARELIRRTWEHESGPTGLVGFVRNGDVYDAVEMLVPRFADGSSRHQAWAPWDIAGFKPIDDLAAVWQVSPYGGDAHLREPGSKFPATLLHHDG